MKIDIRIGDYPVPTVYYLVTDLTGKILNTSSLNIVVEKPILNTKLIDLETAKQLNEKSIDIYNSSAPFFNDICFTFSSEKNGKDVTLKDRRDDYYVNVTFCESECELSYIDYVNVKVVCNCNLLSDFDNFELLSFSNLKNAFIKHLFNYNYKIIKCYKLVFDAGDYDNVGTIFIFISIIISIICTFLYIKYHNIEPVKNSLKKFQPENNNNEERIDSISRMKKMDDKGEINDNVEKNKFKNNNYVIISNENNQISVFEKQNKDKSLNSIVTKSNILKERTKNNLTLEEIENKKRKMEELKYDLGQLDFEEALIYDNRTIKQKYWDYLLQSQLILSNFYADLILELRYIKIMLLMINLSLQFFFNCFFYTDEYISDVYHRNAVSSFFSDLPKVIYAILISFICKYFIKNFKLV